MSDRIAVMNHGRIEQIGSPAEVYDSPATAYVAGFIGQQNFFEGSVSAVTGGSTTVAVPGATIASAVTPPVPLAAGDGVTVAVRPESVTITRGAPTGPNAIAATLMSISQLGSYLQVVTLTGEGRKIVARTSRSADLPTDIGAAVSCSWPAGAVRVYPAA